METRSCAGLYPRAHEVLCLFSQKVDRWGVSKAGVSDVARRLDLREQEIRDVISDLEGFVKKLTGDRWCVQELCSHPCEEIVPSTRLKNQKLEPSLRSGLNNSFVGVSQNHPERSERVVSNFARARARTRETRSPELWTSRELVDYFFDIAPDLSLNRGALLGTFARWRQHGRTSPEIKKMIDLFVAKPGKLTAPAWKKFIWKGDALHARVSDYRQTMEEHRHDAAYWGPVNV